MALHIQMSEEAEKEYKRAKLRGMLSSFGAASALSLAFGLTLTFTVIYFAQDPPAEFLAYVPPAEDAPPRNQPTTPQLSTKTATPSNTVAPSVIVTTGAAPVAMAQIDIPMEDSQDDGLSLDIGIGMDAGLGELGEEGGGMGSSQSSGSALEGVFYDLSRTKSGSPNKVGQDANAFYAELAAFYKTWNPSVLSRFYKTSTKLYASNFYLPAARSELAPEAFQYKMKANTGWFAIYRGKVKSPLTSKIRFIGTGDNGIAVRFGGKVVLEAGYRIYSLWEKKNPNAIGTSGALRAEYRKKVLNGEIRAHKGYEFIKYPGFEIWNDDKTELGGLVAGHPISVKEGTVYPIEIAINDNQGNMGYVLMWEDMLNNPVIKNSKLVNGKKAYLFRTNFSMPEKQELLKMIGKHAPIIRGSGEMNWGEFDPDSPIWVAVP